MPCVKILFVLFLANFAYIEGEAEKIHLFDAPDLVKNKALANNSAYGIVDANYDYEELYKVYCNNTTELENGHFSKKVVVDKDEKNNYYLFHLIFTHWFVGELFKFSEEHTKKSNDWWPVALDFEFKGKDKADMWIVDKAIVPGTKSSWVGDNLKSFYVYLAFIDMGKGKTRLYCHMIVDADGCRKVEEVKNEVVKALEKILELAEIAKKKEKEK